MVATSPPPRGVNPPLTFRPFDPVIDYDRSGYVTINHYYDALPSLDKLRIPLDNLRYSEEPIPCPPNLVKDQCKEVVLWAPVLGPLKSPGLANDGFFALNASSDNALYYAGGLALATFALEHKLSPNDYSIQYARRIVAYFLQSEMWEGNGYILRRPAFFNSGRTLWGTQVAQGASSEELLGLSLGLLFYLKFEDPGHPLYTAASRLRMRVLKAVMRGPLTSGYAHPFMNSTDDPTYWVKHFEFALRAPVEDSGPHGYSDPNFYNPLNVQRRYLNPLTFFAGDSNPAVGASDEFENVMMFLTSMILVLESDHLRSDRKEWFAHVFMEEFIQAILLGGPFPRRDLRDNLYLASIALLANKYLNVQRDSEIHSHELRNIWYGCALETQFAGTPVQPLARRLCSLLGIRDHFGEYLDLVGSLKSSPPAPRGQAWQHNLPLLRADRMRVWTERNTGNGIGGFFIWRYPADHYVWDNGEYYNNMPGWLVRSDSGYSVSREEPEAPLPHVVIDSGNNSEQDYRNGPSKLFSSQYYVEEELRAWRGSSDNQVEGAGLDLLFLRMLLAYINRSAYPPPSLKSEPAYRPLQFPGAEPLHPQLLRPTYSFSSGQNPCEIFEIGGDRPDALRVVELPTPSASRLDFVVVHGTKTQRLRLVRGMVSDGTDPTVPPGIHLDTKGRTSGRFDRVSVASGQDPQGRRILVTAERAEEARSLRDSHWLRVTKWQIPDWSPGVDPNPGRLGTWESGTEGPDAFQSVDLTMLGSDKAAVLTKTRQDKIRLHAFSLSGAGVVRIFNRVVGQGGAPSAPALTSAHGDIVVFPLLQHWVAGVASSASMVSLRWNGSSFVETSRVPILQPQTDVAFLRQAFDVATIAKGTSQFVVGAFERQDRLLLIASWKVERDGRLTYRGEFSPGAKVGELLNPETFYEHASVKSAPWTGNRAGFVIAAKGDGLTVRRRKRSGPQGLKVLYGYLLDEPEEGRPTVESASLYGAGDSDEAMDMLDVSGLLEFRCKRGVLTAHQSKNNYLRLQYWRLYDPFRWDRWPQRGNTARAPMDAECDERPRPPMLQAVSLPN